MLSKGRNKKGKGPAQANPRALDPCRSRNVFQWRRKVVLQDTMLMRAKSEVMAICYNDDDGSVSYDLQAWHPPDRARQFHRWAGQYSRF